MTSRKAEVVKGAGPFTREAAAQLWEFPRKGEKGGTLARLPNTERQCLVSRPHSTQW